METEAEITTNLKQLTTPRTMSKKRKPIEHKSWRKRITRMILYAMTAVMLLGVLMVGYLFITPSGNNLRYLIADTIITTQHRQWAKYIIGQAELDSRVKQYQKSFDDMGEERDNHIIQIPGSAGDTPGNTAEVKKDLVEIEPISGKGYSGYVMTVNDPKKIRLGIPSKPGRGERVF